MISPAIPSYLILCLERVLKIDTHINVCVPEQTFVSFMWHGGSLQAIVTILKLYLV